jgi:hypothetical protein
MSHRPSTDNPFSASRIRPGAVEFLFGEGDSIAACLVRLSRNGGWGQIRGPHGSGKSTLLCALVPRLEESGRRVVQFTLQDRQRSLPVSPAELDEWDQSTQVIIDGFEQLSWINRWRIKRFCRRRGCGLLITTHRDLGFPDVTVTAPTVELAHRIAARLLDGWPGLIQSEDVEKSFAEHGGDLRETFFALYDLYETRKNG